MTELALKVLNEKEDEQAKRKISNHLKRSIVVQSLQTGFGYQVAIGIAQKAIKESYPKEIVDETVAKEVVDTLNAKFHIHVEKEIL